MLKTKIICTLGPASDGEDTLRALVRSGMNVARLNFSHGTHGEHSARIAQLRRVCREENRSVAIMLDDMGPEIRTGAFPDGQITVNAGQRYTLTAQPVPGDAARCSVSYASLPDEVKRGDTILIDDGLVGLEVLSAADGEIVCEVKNSGEIGAHKSVNLPGVSIRLPSMSDKDRLDFLFAIENDLDFIAVSFARRADDILQIAEFLRRNGGAGIRIIAKIEAREAYSNIDEIIAASDAVMIARGDLGVELPFEQIPRVQKDIIRRCGKAAKPVITATQMLDSMIRNPRPTRAEVSDVANAIYDGTSAVMLSGETASGKYPVEALETMLRITQTTEENINYRKRFRQNEMDVSGTATAAGAICHATCTTALDLNAAAIVAVTASGSTALRISAFRPDCPIVAPTPDERTFRQLNLAWGVVPTKSETFVSTDELFEVAAKSAAAAGAAKSGDVIVITAGVPLGVPGTTNMLKAQIVE
ncbi:MAG: pyruvate kinase [Oscillospiraceae bacterium]|jgi:pyruvate kinase|nr:pyruvate kinase [Oscillospiraceae bacterium]